MAFDLSNFEEMKKYADFGAGVVELAKQAGIIPKRAKRIYVTKTKTRVVVRKPRAKKDEPTAVPAEAAPASA